MNLKGKTYVLCLGTFACHIGRELQRTVGDDRYIWMMDGNDNGFLGSCIRHCQIEDKFILLTACGGKTGSRLTDSAIAELQKWNLKFTAVSVLPSLMEGGANIARALWTAEKLSNEARSIYFMENRFHVEDGLDTIKEGVAALSAKVCSLIVQKDGRRNRQEQMNGLLADYRKSAMQHEKVLYSIGCMYQEGRTVQKDASKAFEHFQKAANIGHAGAWCRIGGIHENNKDYINALSAYTNAAYKGDADGACRLARLYEEGLGTEKDDSTALNWYIRAARLNHPEGMLKFACFLLDGRGVERNRMLGLKNLRLAAETGYAPAREELVRRLREDRSRRPGLKLDQKLTLLVIESGFSARMYATKIGYPFNRFQEILDGKSDADIPLLKAILKSYPNVDLKYLLSE